MVTTPSSMSSLKMSFIIVWNVAGLFVRLKNMTRGSKRPQFVQKAAFHSSPSLIQTLLYPQGFVQLSEILGLGLQDFVEDVKDQREKVGVLHGHSVEFPVVLDQAKASILHLNEEDWGCHG